MRCLLLTCAILHGLVAAAAAYETRLGREALELVPNVQNVWAVLESREPYVVTSRLDIGGLEGTMPVWISGNGASFLWTTYRLNGLEVTDPVEPGRPLVRPVPEDLAEVRTSGPPLAGAGLRVGVASRLAEPGYGERWTGRLAAGYVGGRLQAEHGPSRKTALGATGERYTHSRDAEFSAAWPLGSSGALATGFSRRDFSKSIPGAASAVRREQFTGRGETRHAVGEGRLHLVVMGAGIARERVGVGRLRTDAASANEFEQMVVAQAAWSRPLGEAATVAVGVSLARAHRWSVAVHALSTATPVLDVVTGAAADAPAWVSDATRHRLVLRPEYRTEREGWGAHALTAALEGHLGWGEEAMAVQTDRVRLLGNASPFGEARVDGPATVRDRVALGRLEVEDVWRPGPRLTLTGALAPEVIRAPLPAGNSVIWLSATGRLEAAYVLFGERSPFTVRAGVARHPAPVPARLTGGLLPEGLAWRVVRSSDGATVKRHGPDLVGVAGNLRRPAVEGVRASLEQRLGRAARVELAGFAWRLRHRVGLVNVGVPDSAYTIVTATDAGGRPFDAREQGRATLGQDRYELRNPDGPDPHGEGAAIAFDITALPWLDLGGVFTAFLVEAQTSHLTDELEMDPGVLGPTWDSPNARLRTDGRASTDRAFTARAWAFLRAPWGSRAGIVARYWDGRPFWARHLLMLEQGPTLVVPNEQAYHVRTEFHLTLDVRVEHRAGPWVVGLDGYNLLNFDNNLVEADMDGQAFEERRPAAVQPPRAVRASLGYLW